MKKILANLFFITLFSYNSIAGVKLIFDVTDIASSKKSQNIMILTDDFLKMDFTEDGEKFTMIYNSKTETIYNIDHDEEEYMVITKKDIEEMKNKMQSMMKQNEEAMAGIGNMLGDMMGSNPFEDLFKIPEFRIEKTKDNKQIDGKNTTKVLFYIDDEISSEMYMVSLSEIEINKSDMQIFEKFSNFSKSIFETVPGAHIDPFSYVFEQFKDHFAILSYDYEDGDRKSITQLGSHSSYNYNLSDFEIPKGYDEIKMPKFDD